MNDRSPLVNPHSRFFLMTAGRLLLASLICVGSATTVSAQREIQALWLAPGSADSPDAALRAVESALTSGYTTLLVPVSIHADAPEALGELISHARTRGLRVYAALKVNLAAAAGELPPSRDHVIYQHPEWLMVPRELSNELSRLDVRGPDYVGRLARWTRARSGMAGLYVSPIHAETAAYIAAAVRRVAARYAVDGVQLDALEYPDDEFDYSRLTIDVFRRELRAKLDVAERARVDQVATIDPFAYIDEYADEWRRFRQGRLTALLAQVRAAVEGVRPGALISASLSGDPSAASRDNLQEWRAWLDEGLVDAISRRRGAIGSILFDYDIIASSPAASEPAVPKDSAAGPR